MSFVILVTNFDLSTRDKFCSELNRIDLYIYMFLDMFPKLMKTYLNVKEEPLCTRIGFKILCNNPGISQSSDRSRFARAWSSIMKTFRYDGGNIGQPASPVG